MQDSKDVLNYAFGLHLLMEDSSSTIEWARSEGKGFEKLFVFLLSADSLRYTRQNVVNEQSHSLAKLVSSYIFPSDGSSSPVLQIAPRESIQLIEYLVKRKVPLHCSLQTICEIIWDMMMTQVSTALVDSRVWASLRKNIVRTAKKDLSVILSDRESRKCFEEYLDLCSPGADLTCLLSWRDTNKTLLVLEEYKKKEPVKEVIVSTSNRRSSLRDNNAPVALSTSTSGIRQYTDAYDALKVLLSGARQLQHRYFSQSQVQEGLSGQSYANSLAVPSESLRLELASTLATTSAVRDVHAVETTFALTCAGRLERLLRGIERETFQHLESIFPAFLESYHYIKLVTESSCRESEKILDLKNQLVFLRKLVGKEVEDGVIVDSTTFLPIAPPASELQGELFTRYEKSPSTEPAIYDEGCFIVAMAANLKLGTHLLLFLMYLVDISQRRRWAMWS